MSTRTILNDSMEIIIVKPSVVRFSHLSVLVTTFFKQMKTVFKVGMSVYDQVFYPNQKGTVKRIDNNEPDIDFPIEVEFKGEIESYTLKGSRSYAGALTLSTAPYTLQGFEQKAPVPTFEEVIKDARSKGDYYYLHGLEAPSEELADATMALLKLLFLRDYYNKGWQPNYKNRETKYTIYTWSGLLTDGETFDCNRILCFKTEEIRDKFLEEQRELLEKAKPLL